MMRGQERERTVKTVCTSTTPPLRPIGTNTTPTSREGAKIKEAVAQWHSPASSTNMNSLLRSRDRKRQRERERERERVVGEVKEASSHEEALKNSNFAS